MISCQRHLFDIPDDIIYLNCGYMSPLLRSVVDAGRAGFERKARPWNIRAEHFFDSAEKFRELAAGLFRCTANDVAIVPSASYGISTAAKNLPLIARKKILVLDDQFPSNYYPWERLAQEKGAELVTVPWPETGDWTSAVLRALTKEVTIAALPHTHWTSGGLLDLIKIGEACRRLDIALVLDLTQSLGAHPFDAQAVQPDFAVAAAYKWLLGPYTCGAMYVAPKWHKRGRPLDENWILRDNARDFSGLVRYTDGYEQGARRFDMGERANFALLPAANRALEQLGTWGVSEISATIATLNQRLVTAATELGYGVVPEPFRAPHYVCLRTAKPPSKSFQGGLTKNNIYISVRAASIRVTPHVYNSVEEIDRLIEVLRGGAARERHQTSVSPKQ
jgi:selenocysteine lyase/cysteine desulfurase